MDGKDDGVGFKKKLNVDKEQIQNNFSKPRVSVSC